MDPNDPNNPQPQSPQPGTAQVPPQNQPATPVQPVAPSQPQGIDASPQPSAYASPASSGQFGSYPPANTLPPSDTFGSAASPYTPNTPIGVAPSQPISNSFPSSPPLVTPQVATTEVGSNKSKKLWMIVIPLVILLIGGGGAAAYFLLLDNKSVNTPSPEYTITPREVSESPSDTLPTEETAPVESGFANTETQPADTVDTTQPAVDLPTDPNAPADSEQSVDQGTVAP